MLRLASRSCTQPFTAAYRRSSSCQHDAVYGSVRSSVTMSGLPAAPAALEGASRKKAKNRAKFAVLHQAKAPAAAGPRPLHEVLVAALPDACASATAAKRLCRRGLVLLNDAAAQTTSPVNEGDDLKILTRAQAAPALPAKDNINKLEVAFEDEHFAVVVKPQGMVTQGRVGTVTASECIKYSLTASNIAGILARPTEVHRLDAETGGLLMCAKTHPALVGLTQALEKRTMKKRYRAIVRGHLEGCGRITLALSGKECWTEYRAVSHSTSALCGSITTVDLWPHTGRKHQLRLHMLFLGHPILGDCRYWLRRRTLNPVDTSRFHSKLDEVQLIDSPQEATSGAIGDSSAAAAVPKNATSPPVDPAQGASAGTSLPQDALRSKPALAAAGVPGASDEDASEDDEAAGGDAGRQPGEPSSKKRKVSAEPPVFESVRKAHLPSVAAEAAS